MGQLKADCVVCSTNVCHGALLDRKDNWERSLSKSFSKEGKAQVKLTILTIHKVDIDLGCTNILLGQKAAAVAVPPVLSLCLPLPFSSLLGHRCRFPAVSNKSNLDCRRRPLWSIPLGSLLQPAFQSYQKEGTWETEPLSAFLYEGKYLCIISFPNCYSTIGTQGLLVTRQF